MNKIALVALMALVAMTAHCEGPDFVLAAAPVAATDAAQVDPDVVHAALPDVAPNVLLVDSGAPSCVFVYSAWDTTCDADSGPVPLQGASLLGRDVEVILPDGGTVEYHQGASLLPIEPAATGCATTPSTLECCTPACCVAWAAYAPLGCS
jgi:hypothetical protein